jgi:hypothetical protein
MLRDLERKYNLTQLVGSREAKERGMTRNEKEMMERNNLPTFKATMQVNIGDILESKNHMSASEFIFNQASTGYVSGISHSYQG